MKKDTRNFLATIISVPAILAGAVGVHALTPAEPAPVVEAVVDAKPIAPPVATATPVAAPAKKAAPVVTKKAATVKPAPVVVAPTPVVTATAPAPVVVVKQTPTKRVRTTRAS